MGASIPAELRRVRDGPIGSLPGLNFGLPILLLFLFWELIARTFALEVLPPFSAVVIEFVNLTISGEVGVHLFHSLFRGMAGVLIAVFVGVTLGLLMARYEALYRNVDPLVSLTYPVPKSALIPLLIVWVGSGHESRIILAIIGSILPILISTYNGARGTSRNLVWAARSMGVSDFGTLRKVVFPSTLPEIMTGIRIGIIFSYVIVISSEMIIAQTGLGLLVVRFGQLGQYERVFGTILWITILVSGIDRLYLRISSHVLRWSEQEVGGI